MIEETEVKRTLKELAASAKAEYETQRTADEQLRDARLSSWAEKILTEMSEDLVGRIDHNGQFAIVDGIAFTAVLTFSHHYLVMEGECPKCGRPVYSDPVFSLTDIAVLLEEFTPDSNHWQVCDNALTPPEPTADQLVGIAYAVLAETRKDLDVAREDYDAERRSLEIAKNAALLDGSYQALGSNDKTRDAALREQVLVVRYEMLDVAEREYHKAQLAHDLARYEVEALRMQVALRGGGE
jgi:hypothetical protein